MDTILSAEFGVTIFGNLPVITTIHTVSMVKTFSWENANFNIMFADIRLADLNFLIKKIVVQRSSVIFHIES